MKNELKRLMSFKSILAIILLVLMTPIFISIAFNESIKSNQSFYHGVEKYENKDEIIAKIDRIKVNLEDEDLSEYQRDYFEKTLLIYQYLYDNDIRYENVREEESLSQLDSSEDFLTFSSIFILIASGFLAISLCIGAITYDFDIGTSVLIYNRTKKDHNVFFNKVKSIIVLAGIVFFIILFEIFIISLTYENDFSLILIVDKTVKSISVPLYKAYYYISFYLHTIYLMVLFSTIAFYIRKTYKFILALVILIFLIGILSYFKIQFLSLFQIIIPSFIQLTNYNNIFETLLFIIIKVFIAILLMIYTFKLIKRKELTN